MRARFRDRLSPFQYEKLHQERMAGENVVMREQNLKRHLSPLFPGKVAYPPKGFFDRHAYGECMQLSVSGDGIDKLSHFDGRNTTALGNKSVLTIFDSIRTPKDTNGIKLTLENNGNKCTVTVPEDCELTYMDLLVLAWQQNADELQKRINETDKHIGKHGFLGTVNVFQFSLTFCPKNWRFSFKTQK